MLEQVRDDARIRYAESLTGAPADGIVGAEGTSPGPIGPIGGRAATK
jgi:hypothetical protein